MPSPFPQYTGSPAATSPDVPARYPIGIAGRGYPLDTTAEFTHQSIPLLRPQSDVAGQVSEGSFNPEGFWRRSQESWHEGAGQEFLDGDGSSANRFKRSRGVDIWTRGKISLLPEAPRHVVDSQTHLQLLVAGNHVYYVTDEILWRVTDPLAESGTTNLSGVGIHAGEAPRIVDSITTDGFYVYAALHTNGIHRTQRGTSTSSHYSDLFCTKVEYVSGRLMAAYGNNIYNVTASGAGPAPLYTHPNSDFTWVGFAEGRGHIYAAGYSGDKSIIYKTAIRPDGTALSVPSVAGRLPDGEVIRSIYGYLNFILLGTDKGVRFSVADGSGNLEIGARIETKAPVLTMEGQGSFVWYGGANDGRTMMGRMNLETIVNGVAPAYTNDLESSVATLNNITSIITFNNRRLFTISGLGIFVEHATRKVAEGTITSGWITYGAGEDKSAMAIEFRLDSHHDNIISIDEMKGEHVVTVQEMLSETNFGGGSTTTNISPKYDLGGYRGYAFEVHQTLRRETVDTSLGPVVLRYTLKSQVSADMGSHFIIPILLSEKELVNGGEVSRDVLEEFMFLSGLSGNKSAVTFQYASQSFLVTVEDSQFTPTHISESRTGFNGTLMLKLKVGA